MSRIVRRIAATLAVAALALVGQAAAQQYGNLAGSIIDRTTGDPVAGAEVIALDHGLRTRTDAAGRFRIAGVPAGPVLLQIRLVGYAPINQTVTVTSGREANYSFELVRSPTELTPIIVTANREEQSLADVAASVSVADTFRIRSGRTAGLHEVLRYEPGIQATSRFGLDDVNISVRGSGVRTNFGIRGVAIVMDGVPLTEPDGQTRLDMVELADARQVEVVRGPASALYGGSASGGALNIISKRAGDSPGARLKAQTGSFGFQKYDGSLGMSLGDRGAALLSGAYTWSDGFRQHNTQQVYRLGLRSEYSLGRSAQLALEANTSNLDVKIPGSLTLAEFEADPDQADPAKIRNDWARRDDRFRVGARFSNRLDLGTELSNHSYAFYSYRFLDHPIFQVLEQNLDRVQLGHRTGIPVRLGNVLLKSTVGVDFDRISGSDKRFVNVGGSRGPIVADGEIKLPNVGAYGQVEAWLSDAVSVTGGLRYDYVKYDLSDNLDPSRSSATSFAEWSPKGTISVRPSRGLTLYGSVAKGFEPPTLSEITASADPNETFNSALEPQRSTNYEIGLKTLLADRIFVSGAMYRTDIRGEFIARTVSVGSGPPTTVFDNAGKSRHRGIEIGATVLATSWLDVLTSYTLSDFVLQEFVGSVTAPDGSQQPVDFAGNALPGVPRHRIGGELRVRPVSGLTIGVGAEWQSKVFVDNGNTDQGTVYVRGFGPNPSITPVTFSAVPDYVLAHANLEYRFRSFMAFFSVENLFDKTYSANVSTNAADGRFYSAGAGRYLSAGIQLAAWSGGF